MKVKVLTVVAILEALLFLSACGKSDAELTNAVNDKLAAEKITSVTATVKDGTATLTGEVDDRATKTRAEAAARSVEGIKSVDGTNLLTKPTPAPPDPALKAKIEGDLKKAGCTAVVLNVLEDKVIATGTVPVAKFAECVAIIDQAGLGKMENELTVGN